MKNQAGQVTPAQYKLVVDSKKTYPTTVLVLSAAAVLLITAIGVVVAISLQNDEVVLHAPHAPPPSPPEFAYNLSTIVHTVQVMQVGERSSLFADVKNELHPEPFKPTVLKLAPPIRWGGPLGCVHWKIELIVPVDELLGSRPNTTEEYVECEGGYLLTNFTHPGTYRVVATDNKYGHVASERLLVNKYVRRNVYALTASEWEDYVQAVWVLRNVSTISGRSIYTCPSGDQMDYREYDFFVLFHGLYSANATCDQLHFSMMQEFAHEAWNTMFEKALQCVVPSVALHYWNEAVEKERAKGKCASLSYPAWYSCMSEKLKNADVWNSTMYGRLISDEDAAYIVDGAFAKFPIRQNRTGLCRFIEEYRETDTTRCEEYISHPLLWAETNASLSGFWWPSPRPQSMYKFVSRKTGILAGIEDLVVDMTFPGVFNNNGMLENMYDASGDVLPFKSLLRYITNDNVHGHAHYWISGLWGDYAETLNTTLRNSGDASNLLRAFVWPQDARGRPDGCVLCNDTACTGVEGERRSVCEDNDQFTPSDTFDVNASQMEDMDSESWWKKWIRQSRVTNQATRRAYFGYNAARGGTFDRSPTANQDPTFYLHHAFTFAAVDYAKRLAPEPPPFYGLEDSSSEECPGHRLNDTTIFRNLVPYRTDQEPGSAHTWRHILEMWTDERRWFEWEPLL